MRTKPIYWAVVGVGLVALCVVADQMATAQSKRVKSEAKDGFGREADPLDPSSVRPSDSFNRPAVGNRRALASEQPEIEEGRGFGRGRKGEHSYREIVETIVDDQGQRREIRRTVPVYSDFNNEFAQRKNKLNQSIRDGVEAYQNSRDEGSQREMEEKIELFLGELFDVQQQERETQLKPMEERVKKLRDTLSKRAEMRDDLVQLRLKILLQDADGMGWGPDEFLTPTRDPYSQRGVFDPDPSREFDPNRPVSKPNKPPIPSPSDSVPARNDSEGVEPAESNDTFRAPPKKPAVNPEADSQGLNSNS